MAEHPGAVCFSLREGSDAYFDWFMEGNLPVCAPGDTRDKFFTTTFKGVNYYGAMLMESEDADWLLFMFTGKACRGKSFLFISEEIRAKVTGCA